MKPPAEIGSRTLRRRFGGYDAAAVESLLAELFASYEEVWHERTFLLSRAQRIEHELSQSDELGRRLREVLVSAQRAADEQRRAAEVEAARIVADARARAEENRAGIDAEIRAARAEIERMVEVERELRASTRLLVETALERLAVGEGITAPVADELAAEAEPPEAEPAPGLELPAATVVVPPEQPPGAAALPEPATVPEAEDEDTQESALAPRAEEEAGGGETVRAEAASRWRLDRRSLVLAAGILTTGVLVAIGIWQLSAQAGTSGAVTTAASTLRASAPAVTSPPAAVELASEEAPAVEVAERAGAPEQVEAAPARLVLRATAGDCWVQVRAGSARGTVLYEGFLLRGSTERFVGKRLWLRLGAPGNLAIMLNGQRVDNLPAGTADLVATAAGVRTVSLG